MTNRQWKRKRAFKNWLGKLCASVGIYPIKILFEVEAVKHSHAVNIPDPIVREMEAGDLFHSFEFAGRVFVYGGNAIRRALEVKRYEKKELVAEAVDCLAKAESLCKLEHKFGGESVGKVRTEIIINSVGVTNLNVVFRSFDAVNQYVTSIVA
ncbi:MAG: hypothetical protein HY708_03185 [Ignavibacteriae bacterium]|nr:hypothetical protein [Ignavibacteriota bacterium]